MKLETPVLLASCANLQDQQGNGGIGIVDREGLPVLGAMLGESDIIELSEM